jgi:hypothetical protein
VGRCNCLTSNNQDPKYLASMRGMSKEASQM